MEKIAEFQKEYRFLSNFWYCSVLLDGEKYRSVEHAYAAAKTLDPEQRKQIRTTALTPGDAKRLGRKVTLREDWDKVKDDVMLNLVAQKFSGDEVLVNKLIATDPAELQEGNYWGDVYWGVDLKTGKGQNKLGKILMKVRDYLLGKGTL